MTWSLVEPTSNLGEDSRQRWRPRLRAGHMNSGDRRYYLYGEKATLTLRQATVTRFTLNYWAYPNSDTDPTVTVAGISYPFWTIRGNELYVAHIDVDSKASYWGAAEYDEALWDAFNLSSTEFGPENEVEVFYYSFNDVDESLDLRNQTFQFKDGVDEYWLGQTPPGGSPVVITDDIALPYQQNNKVPEFYYSSDESFVDREGENALDELSLTTQLYLNVPDNKLHNPVFSRFSTILDRNIPESWEFTGPEASVGPAFYPYHGRYVGRTDGSDWIVQQTTVTGDQLAISAYASSQQPTGTAVLGVSFVTGSSYITPTGTVVFPLSGNDNYNFYTVTQDVVDDSWNRLSILAGSTDNITTGGVDIALPTGEFDVVVKLGGTGVAWDAAVVEPGLIVSDFSYLDLDDTTIEFETREDGIFQPVTANEYPYDIADVDLNPVLKAGSQGFLTFLEDPYLEDLHLGYGKVTEGESNRDWASYTGEITDAVTGVLDEFVTAEADFIEIATGETYNMTGLPDLVGYFPLTDTGLDSSSKAETYVDSLTGVVSDSITGNDLAGLFFDVSTYAVSGETNDPKHWVTVLTGLQDYMQTNHPGQDTFGIHGGIDLFIPGTDNITGLIRVLDVLVVDGLVQDTTLEARDLKSRRHEIAKILDIEELFYEASTGDPPKIMALDYVEDDYDYDIAAEARYVAQSHGWEHAVRNPSGVFVDVDSHFFTPHGYPSQIDPGATGTHLGRQHTPYGRIDGPGKTRNHPGFRDELPIRDEVSVFEISEPVVQEIIFNPGGTSYLSGESTRVVVKGRPTSPTEEFHYIYVMSALVVDTMGNPVIGVPVHFTCTNGEFLDINEVSVGSTVREYTDHSGYAYTRYRVQDTFTTDSITAKYRRQAKTKTIGVDVT